MGGARGSSSRYIRSRSLPALISLRFLASSAGSDHPAQICPPRQARPAPPAECTFAHLTFYTSIQPATCTELQLSLPASAPPTNSQLMNNPNSTAPDLQNLIPTTGNRRLPLPRARTSAPAAAQGVAPRRTFTRTPTCTPRCHSQQAPDRRS